jgi:hypothetical protein
MKKTTSAANPDAYAAALDGWRRKCVEALRAAVRSVSTLEEVMKWGHLVYGAESCRIHHLPRTLLREG